MHPDKEQRDWLDLFVEAGFEPEQDKRDVVAHLDKHLFDPEPIERRALLEGYVESAFEVHIHCGIRGVLNHDAACEFCAVFKEAGGLNVDQLEPGILPVLKPKATSPECLPGESEFVVLVPVGEAAEDGQWVTLRTLPSLVRLQPLDECNVVWAHTGDLSVEPVTGASASVFELARIARFRRDKGVFVKDGELGAIGGFPVTPHLDQLPSDVVERRPPIVSNVPDDRTPLKGGCSRTFARKMTRSFAFGSGSGTI